MGLFGPPNIDNMKAKRDVKGLIKALVYQQDARVRKAAVIALFELEEISAVEPFIMALKDSDSDVRRAAAEGLGLIGAQLKDAALRARAVEPLIGKLKDSNGNMRWSAAWALGKIGARLEDSALRDNTVELLISTLMNDDKYVRMQAADALSQVGDARSIEPLIAMLKDTDNDIRKAAVGALVKFGMPAIEPLIVALKGGDPNVRKEIVDALQKIGWRPGLDENGAIYWITRLEWDKCVEIGASAIAPLIAEVKNSRFGEGHYAADALGRIGDPHAVEPLIAALTDSDLRVRGAAAVALGQIGDPRAVSPLIAALTDSDLRMREDAVVALGQIGDVRSVKPLIAALHDSYVRMAAIGALVKISKPAVESLIAALRDSDSIVRGGAAGALGEICDARAAESLIAALKEEDENVRGAAASALGQVGAKSEDTALHTRAIELLIGMLKDGASYVQLATTGALDKIGWQPGQDENGAVYWIVKRDWDKCIKIGAPAIAPLIAEVENSKSKWRKTAADALDKIGWQPGQDETGAVYWIVKREWDKCISIGAPAIGPLQAAFTDPDGSKAAADTLDKIGWQPGQDETGAVYWIIKGDWDQCIKIGAPAIAPLIARVRSLIDCLKQGEWSTRRGAADALVKIYRSNLLDEAHKSLILAQRGTITATHNDETERNNYERNSDCVHVDNVTHTDKGIGVNFTV